MKRDFLHVTDFTADEIHETFALAGEVKARFKGREEYQAVQGPQHGHDLRQTVGAHTHFL